MPVPQPTSSTRRGPRRRIRPARSSTHSRIAAAPQRRAGVAAAPAGDVQGRVAGLRGELVVDVVVEDRLPLRHLVRRQALFRRSGGCGGLRHHVGDEAKLTAAALPRSGVVSTTGDDHRLAHGRMLPQGRLDLPGFDPEAAQLDLMVEAPQELEPAVGQETGGVAAAIEAAPGALPPGVRNEALGREGRLAEVAPRQTLPSENQLPGDADGGRPERAVHHMDADLRDRAADGGLEIPREDRRGRGDHRALGGAIVIDQGEGQLPAEGMQRIAAGEQGRRRDLFAARPEHAAAADRREDQGQRQRRLQHRRPQVRCRGLHRATGPEGDVFIRAAVLPQRDLGVRAAVDVVEYGPREPPPGGQAEILDIDEGHDGRFSHGARCAMCDVRCAMRDSLERAEVGRGRTRAPSPDPRSLIPDPLIPARPRSPL